MNEPLKLARTKAKEIWEKKQRHYEATDWEKGFTANKLPCGKKTFIQIFTMGFMEGNKH